MMADGSSTTHSFAPSADTARNFRDAMGQFATGVTLVTIAGPAGPMGFIANSFSSLSLDPPLVLWALAKSSRRYDHFAAASHFAIHILAADQAPLMARFKRDGAGFDGLAHGLGAQGLPLLSGALARLECRQHALHDGGDHTLILGEVLRVTTQPAPPLIFAQGRFGGQPAQI